MAARDATEAFEDVGHSDEARALLKDMLVGDFEKTDVRPCLPHLPSCPLRTLLKTFANTGAQDEGPLLFIRIEPRSEHGRRTGFQVRLRTRMFYVLSDHALSAMYFVPLAMLGAYFAWRYYTSGSI